METEEPRNNGTEKESTIKNLKLLLYQCTRQPQIPSAAGRSRSSRATLTVNKMLHTLIASRLLL